MAIKTSTMPIDKSKFPTGEPDESLAVPADQYHKILKRTLKSHLNRPVKAMLDACVSCGLCAKACHYYCSEPAPELIPAAKAQRLKDILRKHFHPIRSRWPSAKSTEIQETDLQALFEATFKNCTLCGKCALACPMGINNGEILSLARTLLNSIGKAPAGLVSPVVAACREGNYVGLNNDDFVENIEWIAEELAEEFELEDFKVPIDKPDAEVLYVPHPLEVRDLPFLLMYALRIMDAAGENYTLSSDHFDTVNYAYYQGSKDNMMRIAQRMIQAREKLGVDRIVIAPCGHGYRVMKWEAERYLKQKFSFSFQSITERVAQYIQNGQLRLAPDTIKERVTFHDPCNIARRGGIIEAPREIIRTLTDDFVEMHPHGAENFCCGGGGGLGATSDFGKTRMAMGKAKADQIRQTGAKVVVTACFNCMTQIRSLNQEYDLGIEVKSILELVAYAIQ